MINSDVQHLVNNCSVKDNVHYWKVDDLDSKFYDFQGSNLFPIVQVKSSGSTVYFRRIKIQVPEIKFEKQEYTEDQEVKIHRGEDIKDDYKGSAKRFIYTVLEVLRSCFRSK